MVYLARDLVTETKVVIKSIREEYADNAEFHARAIEEGRVLARIDHPNVVRLNAVVVEPGQLYLVMQYIEGNSLDRFIDAYRAQGQMVPLDEAIRIFRMMVQGVAAAHREGVIHRDIKPANILVRARDGVVKVSDFGIAKTGDAIRTGRMRTLGIVGSPAYMAPEQRAGARDLDRRADIYSLGIVFFELLTGRLPFVAATEPELVLLHSQAILPSLRGLRPELPTSLDDILARACAKDRRDRFSTCEELDAALAQGGLPVMRSVPPTIMATQGLPSIPPPPAAPHGSSPPYGSPPHGTPAPPVGSSAPPPYGSSTPPPPYGSAAPPPHGSVGSSDPPLPPPPVYAPRPGSSRSVWKIVALGCGLVLVAVGLGVGWAYSNGYVLDLGDSDPPLVDPPQKRDAGAPATPTAPGKGQPARVDGAPAR
jgi:serine/threonine-protein kinase